MTRSQLAKLRDDFIDERTALLKRRLTTAELKLYDLILKKVISEFKITGGNLNSTNANIDIANRLNGVFKNFNATDYLDVIKQFATDISAIQVNNSLYFKTIENDKKKLANISKAIDNTLQKRIGVKGGKLTKDGFLDRLIKDNTLLNKVKKETYKAVSEGKSLVAFKKSMSTIIVGNKNVDGGLQRHFSTFAYDTYAQFDRTAQKLYADKLGLNAFIYAGGLKTTSREFCRKHNNKVYTNAEAQKWEDTIGDEDGVQWDDSAYDPIIDMGGFNCRHLPNYISDADAISERPELKSKLG